MQPPQQQRLKQHQTHQRMTGEEPSSPAVSGGKHQRSPEEAYREDSTKRRKHHHRHHRHRRSHRHGRRRKEDDYDADRSVDGEIEEGEILDEGKETKEGSDAESGELKLNGSDLGSNQIREDSAEPNNMDEKASPLVIINEIKEMDLDTRSDKAIALENGHETRPKEEKTKSHNRKEKQSVSPARSQEKSSSHHERHAHEDREERDRKKEEKIDKYSRRSSKEDSYYGGNDKYSRGRSQDRGKNGENHDLRDLIDGNDSRDKRRDSTERERVERRYSKEREIERERESSVRGRDGERRERDDRKRKRERSSSVRGRDDDRRERDRMDRRYDERESKGREMERERDRDRRSSSVRGRDDERRGEKYRETERERYRDERERDRDRRSSSVRGRDDERRGEKYRETERERYRDERERDRGRDRDYKNEKKTEETKRGKSIKEEKEEEEEEDYEEKIEQQLCQQDEEERIKEESRRRREAILEKYRQQKQQSHDTNRIKEEEEEDKKESTIEAQNGNNEDKEKSPIFEESNNEAFTLDKSPATQNGVVANEKAPGGAAGLGEGAPKSELSADMFCEDIFGDTPSKVQNFGKGDKMQIEKGGLYDNWDDAEGYYSYRFGEVLDGRYEIIAAQGKGVFSTVVRAKDLKAGKKDPEEVAIKIIRNNETMYKAGMEELIILKKLVGADPEDRRHCVRFLSSFKYRNHLCLVFESLHMNLREVLKKFGRNIGLKLTAVRAYATQLLIALKHLKNCGVLHCDIKPDNMLVNEAKNVLKLCDFGNAMFAGQNEITPYLVSRFYRAPEIILGLTYDHPLDIWSVGCCLYELYTGKVLFPGPSNNDMLRLHMELKGPFPKKMLKKAAFIDHHFDQNLNFHASEEDPVTKKTIKRLMVNVKPKDIGSLMSSFPGEEAKLVATFKDILERIFVLDPDKRMTVSQALNHPFITGK